MVNNTASKQLPITKQMAIISQQQQGAKLLEVGSVVHRVNLHTILQPLKLHQGQLSHGGTQWVHLLSMRMLAPRSNRFLEVGLLVHQVSLPTPLSQTLRQTRVQPRCPQQVELQQEACGDVLEP